MSEQDKIPDTKSKLPAEQGKIGPKLLSDEEVDQLASETGLNLVSGKGVRALKKIGAHLDSVGLIHVKLGTLLQNDEQLRTLFQRAIDLSETAEDEEVKLGALRLQKDVLDSVAKSCELAVKMADAKLVGQGDQGNQKSPTFPVGQQVSPVHISFHNGEKKVEVEGQPVEPDKKQDD